MSGVSIPLQSVGYEAQYIKQTGERRQRPPSLLHLYWPVELKWALTITVTVPCALQRFPTTRTCTAGITPQVLQDEQENWQPGCVGSDGTGAAAAEFCRWLVSQTRQWRRTAAVRGSRDLPRGRPVTSLLPRPRLTFCSYNSCHR